MPSIPDSVIAIQARAAPVLFLDTCVLLDVIRAPLRDSAFTVQAAVEVLTAAQRSPPTVYLVLSGRSDFGDLVEFESTSGLGPRG